MANVLVDLLGSTGNVVSSTLTDDNGYYSFDYLSLGTYSVSIAPPAGTTATGFEAGPQAGSNSDIHPATNASDTFSLTNLQFDANVNAGLIPSGTAAAPSGTGPTTGGTVSGSAFADADANGSRGARSPASPAWS